MRRTLSIQQRVLALAVCLLAAALLALGLASRQYAQRAADSAYDRLLNAAALTIANAIQIDEGELSLELPYSAMAMLSEQEHIFYSVRSANSLISGYPDLGDTLPPATSSEPRYDTISYHGTAVRVATIGRLLTGQYSLGRGWITIRVAETLGTRQALADELLGRSTLSLTGLMLLALMITSLGIRRAFAPLAELETALRERSHDNLQPIDTPVPKEIRRLVDTLNAFMQRLQTAVGTLNNLVADAAHQIRTPLAAVHLQTQLAMDEPGSDTLRPRLRRILNNTTHATHLLNQLLMDATVSHRLDRSTMRPLDVAPLIQEIQGRVDPDRAHRLYIHLTPSARRAQILGDHVSLREMLRNVIDNAMLYSDEPVSVRIYTRPNGWVVFDVSDLGPGISDDDKTRLLERFQRGPSSQGRPGSGLGLSIVRTVVQAHQGTLLLRDHTPQGLTVRIEIPTLYQSPRPSPPLTLLIAALIMTGMLAQPQPAFALASAAEPDMGIRSHDYPARSPRPPGPEDQALLVIAGPTDTELFEVLVQDFQRIQPHVRILYHEMDSTALYRHTTQGSLPETDLLISSAADMQVKLANDGYARAHTSSLTQTMPGWARWRNEVFGFTLEPAVIAYAPARLPYELPASREALLKLLERNQGSLRDRVGTYDIQISGVGYLFALYDERTSSTFWGLANALGRVGTRLYANTGAILDDLDNGTLDVAYNVLGSYALARQKAGSDIAIVVPSDYVSVFTRSALIHKQARRPDLAAAFIDYLLSPQGQQTLAGPAGLGSLNAVETGSWFTKTIENQSIGIIQPLILNPSLLVGLDPTRRHRFLQNWRRLVTDTPARP
ncbi:extracellular solute-binding protein [Alcaligenes ammonioxydans]|uniref:sensor histidine kinase n=1 Tax=Alcaligenes ammonioxydans TaxID=2582914 RepID=UPI001F066E46|nr:extracellular solute-binding protein [Alcaligenes ammonioxydans]MCH1878703.1 extracellular solute-binding protein [Alcaligenes ammonioxydans]